MKELPAWVNGSVTIQWTICPDGSVAEVRTIPRSTLPDEEVACCMTDQVADLTFDHPTNNGTVVVRYPFVFNSF